MGEVASGSTSERGREWKADRNDATSIASSRRRAAFGFAPTCLLMTEEHRTHLRAVAYRMLGSLPEAERKKS
jgi:hypothetical protein